jgi:RNA polymerase sigma-70 factor (ECF subfamily)
MYAWSTSDILTHPAPRTVVQCPPRATAEEPRGVSRIDTEDFPTRLRSAGLAREGAAQELHTLLVRVALAYLARQQYPAEAFGADTYLSVAEDYAQEAFAVILRELHTYRGECRFTTWAYSIIINLIADEMRRRCWRRRPLPEETEREPSARLAEPVHDVAAISDRRALWDLINIIIQRELTPRQRSALVGRVFEEKPLIVLADELGTNKDNVYKLIHDARRHLKRALEERGITTGDALAVVEGGSS